MESGQRGPIQKTGALRVRVQHTPQFFGHGVVGAGHVLHHRRAVRLGRVQHALEQSAKFLEPIWSHAGNSAAATIITRIAQRAAPIANANRDEANYDEKMDARTVAPDVTSY